MNDRLWWPLLSQSANPFERTCAAEKTTVAFGGREDLAQRRRRDVQPSLKSILKHDVMDGIVHKGLSLSTESCGLRCLADEERRQNLERRNKEFTFRDWKDPAHHARGREQ